MIAAILIAGIAFAGAPPVDVIPWDSVLVVDSVMSQRDGELLYIADHWCHFITKDEYESEVLGMRAKQDVKSIKRDLEVIKAILKESER
jgi:hypothetical protein